MGLLEEISERLTNVESLLLKITKTPPENFLPRESDEDKFFTVKEAATFLDLSLQTIYNITHEKRIPFLKRGKKCYFLKADLVQYLKAGRVKSSEEISLEANQPDLKRKG